MSSTATTAAASAAPQAGEKTTELPADAFTKARPDDEESEPNTLNHGSTAEKGLAAQRDKGEHPTPGGREGTPAPVYPEGGLEGWCSLAAAWMIIFCSFGYTNSWGVFQEYYASTRYTSHSASEIAWIGSVQTFLMFVMGGVAGPLFDKGFYYYLFAAGTIIFLVCFFMVSLADRFWQAFLSQGVGIGFGIGFLYAPTLGIVSQYFKRHIGLASGFVTTGSALGGIALPIMVNKLIEKHGFTKAVQYTGYLMLGVLVIAGALIRPFGGVRKQKQEAKISLLGFLKEPAYVLTVCGVFLVAWGLFFPIFFVQIFAISTHSPPAVTLYIVAMLNAGSFVGRIVPNFFADIFGSLNLLTLIGFANAIMTFAFFGADKSTAGLVIVAIIYGFTSGAFVGLLAPALFGFARTQAEAGSRLALPFMGMSVAALTGSPIGGALYDKYGEAAALVFCGVICGTGSACLGLAAVLLGRSKHTKRV